MRWIRLLAALIRAKFKEKVKATDTVQLSFNVWVTDVDVSIMNHAAIMTLFEIGRLDFMVRTNFFSVANKNKWYFPTQAISVQYYRPLKMFQKAQLFSRISYVDEKWIYVEQKLMKNDKVVAACLVKNTIKKGRTTVSTFEIMEALNVKEVPNKKYDLIKTHELETAQMNTHLIENWDV
ncbi:acyl-CoA thioesterase [Hwangdonia lutea]|uniref:Acyl-CoA thioesterase n=1 Tax=Hwangdonia lutea TaxID=3075823 RepID=A0AA97EJJ7_9FLAO|nr:acyl-CoA thioesterase [Hwangdonia sp. SCSIO 19198]WOD42629.1 acyl-CoA thioesterase [Hwangdonia sp. SCSIO 19198]